MNFGSHKIDCIDRCLPPQLVVESQFLIPVATNVSFVTPVAHWPSEETVDNPDAKKHQLPGQIFRRSQNYL